MLARRVWPDGRTRAYVCGRSATLADLQELGGRLLSFYGQHEHRKLMLSTAQLELLDAYCGADAGSAARELRDAYERVRGARAARRRAARAGRRPRARARPAAASSSRRSRRRRRGEAERRADRRARPAAPPGGADAARRRGGAETRSGPRPAAASRSCSPGRPRSSEAAAELDAELRALAERLAGAAYEAEDVGARAARLPAGAGGDGEADGPARLEEVEERLALLARLERKHGGTIAEVLAHAERCRARRDELDRRRRRRWSRPRPS